MNQFGLINYKNLALIAACFFIDYFFRSAAEQNDFVRYADILKTGIEGFLQNPAYFKEILYWVLTGGFFALFDDEFITWAFTDSILIYLLLRAARSVGVSRKLVLVNMLSFYSLIGIFNLHRQYYASVIYVLGIVYESRLMYLAPLFHISVFFNILLRFIERIKAEKYLKTFLYIGSFVVIYLGSSLGDISNNGRYMAYFYFSIFLLKYLFSLSFRLSTSWLWVIFAALFSLLCLPYSQAERVIFGFYVIYSMEIIFFRGLRHRLVVWFFVAVDVGISFFHPTLQYTFENFLQLIRL